MDVTLIIIIILAVFACGGLIAWFIVERRPAKLDPRHERMVQMLVKLQRENPSQAADVVARALVRAGLIWETDLQRVGAREADTSRLRTQVPRPQPTNQNRPPQQRGPQEHASQARAQQPRVQQDRSERPAQSRPSPEQSPQGRTPAPKGALQQPAAPGGGNGTPQAAEHPTSSGRHSRRRRHRRPVAATVSAAGAATQGGQPATGGGSAGESAA